MKIMDTPHEIKVYEESCDGLVKVLIGILIVYTTDKDTTPPDERNKLIIEVN